MKKFLCSGCVVVAGLAWLAGCGSSSKPGATGPSPAGAKFIASAEPAGAKNVDVCRAEAKDGEAIVIVGRIGGDVKPFVEGKAAFEIVDLSRKACSDRPGDTCETPWDFCCEDDLNISKALIQFVDTTGQPVTQDAQQLLGVKELQTVVVQGKAKRDKDNLTVLAETIFVRK